MNPPGGLSIIVHILIVLIGAARRSLVRWLDRTGLSRTPAAREAVRAARALNRTDVQRPFAYAIIGAASFFLLSTVRLSLTSVLAEDTNADMFLRLIQQRNRTSATVRTAYAMEYAFINTAYADFTATCTPTLVLPYDTHSLIEYLFVHGQDVSFSNRKALAMHAGIIPYVGTAFQNTLLLELLRNAEVPSCPKLNEFIRLRPYS